MTRILLAFAPLAALAGLITLFFFTIDRDPDFVPSVLIDKPVPVISLDPVSGLDLEGFGPGDFAGQVTVVNVFASWCIPCRDEHPLLMRLASSGVPVYGINQRDAPENARAFLNDLGNPYVRIGADPDNRGSIEWGVYGVPETFVVDATGTVTYKHTGPLSEKSFSEGLLPAIEAARDENV
jgi:cytochrome c biogenesis protein CcmG/thiol:disulfide interchange protein DsbE